MNAEIRASKTMEIAAAHRLLKHLGKCKNLHGHNYKITVSFVHKSGVDPDTHMVFDFGLVKETVGTLINFLDHKTILEQSDPLLPTLAAQGIDCVALNTPPTTEALSLYLLKNMPTYLSDFPDVLVTSIKVQESGGNSATIRILPPVDSKEEVPNAE